MKKFTGLHVNNLNIDNLFGIIKTTVEISQPMKETIGELPKAALLNLEKINADMEARMKKTLASPLTAELNKMNTHRNQLFEEVKRFVSTGSKSSIDILLQSGTAFKLFLKPYWHTEQEPLNTITSIYEEILARYHADTSLQATAKVLGVEALLTELEHINLNYDTMYKQRNAEVGGKTGNAVSEIKPQAIQCYEQYCIVIEQSVNIASTEALDQLFVEMDGLRRKYTALPHTKKEEEEKK